MKKSIMVLLAMSLAAPHFVLAGGGGRGGYEASGTVVVGGAYGYGPRGAYRGGYGGGGYRGPNVGVYLGAPVFWGGPWGPWGPPAYYPPPVVYPSVVAVPPPVVYVERTQAPASEQSLESGYWYYCRERGGYYPAIMQCPGAWVQVAPRAD
ncbi:hypothetical protein [Candidatus Accumulibacter sp. ACC003]|uniref:hypothetical protein n=1 Tax=Candidatus Accumulibacter sp. ACC003 TaxID=2823334 RepID=UPI0025BF8D3A|nr:hypothetical protein [Candidatus Accumulibacter sp. ACC003]